MKSMFSKIAVLFAVIAGLVVAAPAMATEVATTTAPTAWRLQQYIGSTTALYFTGSGCTSGSLTLPTTTSDAEKSRFFAMVTSAKLTGHGMTIWYESTTCVINSFGMDG